MQQAHYVAHLNVHVPVSLTGMSYGVMEETESLTSPMYAQLNAGQTHAIKKVARRVVLLKTFQAAEPDAAEEGETDQGNSEEAPEAEPAVKGRSMQDGLDKVSL